MSMKIFVVFIVLLFSTRESFSYEMLLVGQKISYTWNSNTNVVSNGFNTRTTTSSVFPNNQEPSAIDFYRNRTEIVATADMSAAANQQNKLTFFDTSLSTVTRPLTTTRATFGMSWPAVEFSTVYVADMGMNRIRRMNLATGQIPQSDSQGFPILGCSPVSLDPWQIISNATHLFWTCGTFAADGPGGMGTNFLRGEVRMCSNKADVSTGCTRLFQIDSDTITGIELVGNYLYYIQASSRQIWKMDLSTRTQSLFHTIDCPLCEVNASRPVYDIPIRIKFMNDGLFYILQYWHQTNFNAAKQGMIYRINLSGALVDTLMSDKTTYGITDFLWLPTGAAPYSERQVRISTDPALLQPLTPVTLPPVAAPFAAPSAASSAAPLAAPPADSPTVSPVATVPLASAPIQLISPPVPGAASPTSAPIDAPLATPLPTAIPPMTRDSNAPSDVNSNGAGGGGSNLQQQDGPSIGLIAGVIVAAVVVALIVIVAFVLLRKKRSEKKKKQPGDGGAAAAPAASSAPDTKNTTYSPVISFGGAGSTPETRPRSSTVEAKWDIDKADLDFGDKIGSGNWGTVFEGEWRGAPVAIKQCIGTLNADEFFAEAKLMSQIRPHKHVCQIYGVYRENGELFLVMELISGGNLLDALQSGSLSMDEKMRIIADVVSGLIHLHAEKILHRDLAARNILMTEDGLAKISDFGMSRAGAEQTNIVTTVGPIRWMAPEAIGSHLYSTKSDVYSFGVLLWEILTNGQTPLANFTTNQVAVARRDHNLTPEIPEDAPEMLVELIKACWATNPDDRPTFKSINKHFASVRKQKNRVSGRIAKGGMNGSGERNYVSIVRGGGSSGSEPATPLSLSAELIRSRSNNPTPAQSAERIPPPGNAGVAASANPKKEVEMTEIPLNRSRSRSNTAQDGLIPLSVALRKAKRDSAAAKAGPSGGRDRSSTVSDADSGASPRTRGSKTPTSARKKNSAASEERSGNSLVARTKKSKPSSDAGSEPRSKTSLTVESILARARKSKKSTDSSTEDGAGTQRSTISVSSTGSRTKRSQKSKKSTESSAEDHVGTPRTNTSMSSKSSRMKKSVDASADA